LQQNAQTVAPRKLALAI